MSIKMKTQDTIFIAHFFWVITFSICIKFWRYFDNWHWNIKVSKIFCPNIPLFWPQNDSRQQSYIINLFFYNKRFYRIDSRLINNFLGKMDSSSSHEFDFKLITHLQCLHDFSYCNTNFTIQFCTKSLHRFTDEYYNPIVIIYSLAFWHRNDIVKLETKDLNVFSRTYLTVLIFRKRIIFVKNFHLNFTVF